MTFEFKPVTNGKLDATKTVGGTLLTLRAEDIRKNKDGGTVANVKLEED